MSKKHIEILATEVDTIATRTSERIITPEGKGLILAVAVANLVTTPTYRPRIQILAANGTWVDYWTSAADITANGNYIYLLYPSLTMASDALEEVNVPLPFAWRVIVTYGGTGDADTTVSAQVI